MTTLSISPSETRLARLAYLVSLVALVHTFTFAQVSDPVPESPTDSGITLLLEDFVTIPQSNGSAPRARINHLKPMYDGQGRLAVNDLRGKFWVITNGAVSEYTDFDAVFPRFQDSPGLGTGFTSFAFHPEFATNGIFYTAHSETPSAEPVDFANVIPAAGVNLHGVITEWTATDPTAATFVGTRREIMRVELVGTIHGMQEIALNPNKVPTDPDYGYLFICIGDGQSTIRGFPNNTSRLDSILGTILRIDPTGTNSANGQYGIPADNPWATDGDPDTFDEIWAYGFRNPHRISWDTGGDGKMLSGEIGEQNIEELNLIEPGRNYGWNQREGTYRINPDWENNPGAGRNTDLFELPADDATLGFTYPVAQYDHDDGDAIVSGFVYRGTLAPALTGKFIFGDILSGEVFFTEADTLAFGTQSPIEQLNLQLDGSPITIQGIDPSNRGDLRFGFDEDNELYLLEKSRGMIFKLVGAIDPNPALESSAGKLINISTRGPVGIGDDVLIGGFVIGESAQEVMVFARAQEIPGITGALADPILTLTDPATGNILATNDDWEDTQGDLINDLWGGSPPVQPGSTSSGIVITLPAGAATATVTGKDGGTGLAIIEVFEVD